MESFEGEVKMGKFPVLHTVHK